jgi:Tfp pilus assembly protein PilE
LFSLGVVKIIAVIGVLFAASAGFFAWANSRTRRAYARSTLSDVEAALEEFVSPDSRDHDTWDLFLSWPIDEPYLESIRQRCQAFAGHDADPAAKDQVRAILGELRAHT